MPSASILAVISAAVALMLSGLPLAGQANSAPVVQANLETRPINAPPATLVSWLITSEDSHAMRWAIFSDPGDTLSITSCTHDQQNVMQDFNCGLRGRLWIQMKSIEDLCAIEPAPSSPLITTFSITVEDSAGNTASTSVRSSTSFPDC